MMSVAMVSLISVVFMYQQTQAQMRYGGMDPLLQDRYSEYRTKEDIYKILRIKDEPYPGDGDCRGYCRAVQEDRNPG